MIANRYHDDPRVLQVLHGGDMLVPDVFRDLPELSGTPQDRPTLLIIFPGIATRPQTCNLILPILVFTRNPISDTNS